MELIENVHYTRTGWRPGDVATLEGPTSRPRVNVIIDAWNAAEDKRAFNAAHMVLINEAMNGYDAALTDEQKAERSRKLEAEMMAEAEEFYRNRPAGSQRSFWD